MPLRCTIAGSNLSLAYDHDPLVFGKPQWRFIPLWLFVVYRIVVASYFFGTLVVFMVVSFTGGFGVDFFFFLTNWGFMFLTTYLIVMATATLYSFHMNFESQETYPGSVSPNVRTPLIGSEPPPQRRTPWYYQLSWVLFNISAISAWMITLVYWPVLYPQVRGEIPFVLDFNIHALTSIVILVEILIASMPIRVLHVVYVFIIAIIYILMTVILYYSGWQNPYDNKPYVYPFLDYSEYPGLAIVSLIAIMIAVIFTQFLLYAIFKIKQRINGVYHVD